MTQVHHKRTVEIHTITASCDECGKSSGAAGRETLLGWGWSLDHRGADRCPDCTRELRDRELRAEKLAARTRYLASLETDETPPLVHGRVLTERGALYTRAEIDEEIAQAFETARRRRWRHAS